MPETGRVEDEGDPGQNGQRIGILREIKNL